MDPTGPLIVRVGAATDLAVDAAVAGTGVIHLFEDWLRPYLDSGALEPVLEPWWQTFSGPFLYYPGRRHLPAPLRAFVDFISAMPSRRRRTLRISLPNALRNRHFLNNSFPASPSIDILLAGQPALGCGLAPATCFIGLG